MGKDPSGARAASSDQAPSGRERPCRLSKTPSVGGGAPWQADHVTYQAADRLDPPMVEVLEDGQWWDGHVEAQERRDGTWWVKVVYRRSGQHTGWFPVERVRADKTDYSRGRG